jgi:hypothetical protein
MKLLDYLAVGCMVVINPMQYLGLYEGIFVYRASSPREYVSSINEIFMLSSARYDELAMANSRLLPNLTYEKRLADIDILLADLNTPPSSTSTIQPARSLLGE